MVHLFETVFGSGEAPIAWWQVCTRAFIYFFAVLIYLHIAGIRSIGRQSALDIIMGIMLGAVLGQGLAGKASAPGTLLGGLILALLYRLLAFFAAKSQKIEHLAKGKADQLIKDGRIIEENMKRNLITIDDLHQGLRSENCDAIEDVKEAWFERSGKISVVPKKKN